MAQKPKRRRGLPLLLLIVGNGAALCLFGLLFVPAPALQGQAAPLATDWLALPPLRTGVGDPAVVVVQDKIHVIGGNESFGASGFHEAFDPATGRWESLPDLPRQLSDAVAAVVDGQVYVVGGYNAYEGGALSANYRYDPATGHWVTATELIVPASGAGAAVINNAIYVFGGYDNVAESALVQRYDPVQDRWTLQTPMPVARSQFGLATVDGLIYLIGGNLRVYTDTTRLRLPTTSTPTARTYRGKLSTLVSVYDPVRDLWRDAAPLPAPRVAQAVTAHDGLIYVIGGADAWISGTVQSTVYCYNPILDQWSTLPPLLTPRSGLRAVALHNMIYSVGGYDQAFVPLPNHEAYALHRQQLYLPVIQQ